MLLMKPFPDVRYHETPATIPRPVQLSGPKCKPNYRRVFNPILWALYTGKQWKRMPVPRASDGTGLIRYTTMYKVFAKWDDDGSLDRAFIVSVRQLAEQQHLDLRVPHDDGTNRVAKKIVAMVSAIPATNIEKVRRSSQSSTIVALCWFRFRWRR